MDAVEISVAHRFTHPKVKLVGVFLVLLELVPAPLVYLLRIKPRLLDGFDLGVLGPHGVPSEQLLQNLNLPFFLDQSLVSLGLHLKVSVRFSWAVETCPGSAQSNWTLAELGDGLVVKTLG